MTAYYNEIDPVAAQWLRNLIVAGLIAPGDVDERDIRDIVPNELRGYTQCHFFAGIGIWSHALRTAGWSDDRPVWTGSCPCQPFSAAGGRAGVADERHLWPHWHHLIRECRPAIVLGEQVASKDGLGWLDLVQDDLEGTGYAFAAFDLCAAGFGVAGEWEGNEWLQWAILSCPDPVVAEQLRDFAAWAGASLGTGGAHIRQRLYGYGVRMGQSDITGSQPRWITSASVGQGRAVDAASGAGSNVADADGWNTGAQRQQRSAQYGQQSSHGGGAERVVDSDHPRSQRWPVLSECRDEQTSRSADMAQRPSAHQPEWVLCNDPDGPRWRPVRPGTFPLVDAAPARMGRLRAYGNGLDAETATRFIEVVMA